MAYISFKTWLAEEAPANAAGEGHVAGIGVGEKGEPGVWLSKKKKDIKEKVEPVMAMLQRK